jgi:putative RecB family exonuclease
MLEGDPELATLHATPEDERAWLADAADRVATYFSMENPQRLEPAAREEFVEWQLDDGPLLRGVIDRVDVAGDGSIRVVDYKTGKSPSQRYGAQAKFQMRFYALLVERLRGRRASILQLLYLKDGQAVVLRPTAEDLDRIEHEVREIWGEITRAARESRWRTRKGPLCAWCSFQELCPEFGGTPPPIDPDAVRAAIGVDPA